MRYKYSSVCRIFKYREPTELRFYGITVLVFLSKNVCTLRTPGGTHLLNVGLGV